MAIADTITSMQNHTSNAYTMIGYGTDLTGINKNLENLSSTIFEAFLEALRNPDTLFTNLPKISGNGTQITLNDTANAPMRITLNPSALSQDGTPTPSSPQDIHTISGNNSVVVEGKNFISIPSNCVITGGPNIIDLETPIPIGTYIVSIDNFINGGTGRGLIHFLNDSGTQVAYALLDNSNKTATINITSPITKLRLYSQNNASASIGITSTYVNMMVSINGGDYEPYVSQTAQLNLGNIEYCKIGDYEDEFILTSGKNLFDKDTVTNGYYIASDGSLVAQASSWYSDYIAVKPLTTYTIQVPSTTIRVAEYNNSKTFIQRLLDTSSLTYTFTTDSNTYFIRLSGEATQLNSEQLEEGSTATSYEPYGTNQWYLKKNIGKVVLDGSESWGTNSAWNYTNTNVYHTNLGLSTNDLISNYFTYSSTAFGKDIDGLMQRIWTTNFMIRISNITAPDIASFKTWLSTHNTIVYYPLSTPTYTQITGTLETQLENIYKNMLSYKGTTNVSQINNDLPFVLGVSAIQDLE